MNLKTKKTTANMEIPEQSDHLFRLKSAIKK